jgi:hypothetical protein
MEGRIRLFYLFAVLIILILTFRSCYIDRRGVKIKPTKTKTLCQDTSEQFTF